MILFLSVAANATTINMNGGTSVPLNSYIQDGGLLENGVLIEDLGILNTIISPTHNNTGIYLYDAGIKISMFDNSLFDLISLGWTDWNTGFIHSRVFYEDSNGETLPSNLLSDLTLNQTFFGTFGQNVEWVKFTSLPAGPKTLDYIEVEAVSVPEPGILALLGFGLFGMLSFRKSKAV